MLVNVSLTRPGKDTTVFNERLVIDRPDVKILLLHDYSSGPIHHAEQIVLGKGAPILWFVFPGSWHEVGRFHTHDNQFTGWYTNLCTPFEIHEAEWSTTDLFLDFWQTADGLGTWLDEEELQDAFEDGLVDIEMLRQIQRERRSISESYESGEWPPPVTKSIDLEYIHRITK